MQANIVFKGGTSAIIDIEKIHIETSPHDGHLTKLEWTHAPDGYALLKYVDVAQVAAVVLIRSMEEGAR